MTRFNGVNHLAMATGDMYDTIRFWRDLLGMRLAAGLGKLGYRHYFFQIDRKNPVMLDKAPTETAQEGAEPRYDRWPGVTAPTLRNERPVYPGAGSEYFHGRKKE